MGSEKAPVIETTENKSGRYISLSVLLHAAMVASVALLGLPPSDFSPKNVVEFEVESDVIGDHAIADGVDVPETKGVAAVSPSSAAEPAPAVAPAPPAPSAKAPPAKAATAAPPSAPAVSEAPATVDDIQAPDLETSEFGDVAVPVLEDKDLDEDFEKIDQQHDKALSEAKEDFNAEAQKIAAANEAALAEAEAENRARAKAAQEAREAQEARRAEQAAALADAKAAEEAAAEQAAAEEHRAAQEKANADAAAAAALAAKVADSAKENGSGTGTADEGEGTGNAGSPLPTIEVAGIPGGVRSLGQLRQMPGNRFPQYSRPERLAGQEGDVIFYAYVNRDGSLSQFKLGKSSGYRNLDGKTLAALKKWKFYPGQEGWVEMPFQWALRGEAREAGGQLRK